MQRYEHEPATPQLMNHRTILIGMNAMLMSAACIRKGSIASNVSLLTNVHSYTFARLLHSHDVFTDAPTEKVPYLAR